MDWNRIEGNWKQVKGKVKEKWGKLHIGRSHEYAAPDLNRDYFAITKRHGRSKHFSTWEIQRS